MAKRSLLFALSGALALFACRMEPDPAPRIEASPTVQIGEILWHVDIDAALEVARAQDKALWMHFGENPG